MVRVNFLVILMPFGRNTLFKFVKFPLCLILTEAIEIKLN